MKNLCNVVIKCVQTSKLENSDKTGSMEFDLTLNTMCAHAYEDLVSETRGRGKSREVKGGQGGRGGKGIGVREEGKGKRGKGWIRG